jgi:hypothetical protein
MAALWKLSTNGARYVKSGTVTDRNYTYKFCMKSRLQVNI